MTDADLDQYTYGRKVYDALKDKYYRIHSVDYLRDEIVMDEMNDLFGSSTKSVSHEYFQNHCVFQDEPYLMDMSVKCECGVDTLGAGNHSDYCPKYKGGN